MSWMDFLVPALTLVVGYRVGVGIERARHMLDRADEITTSGASPSR